jgi:hypothetical protein
MDILQTLVETVTVVIPEAASKIFDSIKGIIGGFGKIGSDPKGAIGDIGKGAVRYIRARTHTMNTHTNE